MRERFLTSADERLIDALQSAPADFVFPDRFRAEIGRTTLAEIDPFMWTSEYRGQTAAWTAIVAEQFPARTLVPLAKHQDTDDVFCFDGGDRSGNPPVLVIHTFASPGTEYRGQWTSFDVWWEEMEDHRAAWLAEHEHEHEDEDEDPR